MNKRGTYGRALTIFALIAMMSLTQAAGEEADRGVDALLNIVDAVSAEQAKAARTGMIKKIAGRALRDFGDGSYSVELPSDLRPTKADLQKTFGQSLASKRARQELRQFLMKLDGAGVGRLLAKDIKGLPASMVRRRNGVTKVYIGQAQFKWKPKRARQKRIKEDNSRKSVINQLMGTVTVDSHGRRWMVVHVDPQALLERLRAYNREAAEPGVEMTLSIADLHRAEPATEVSEGEWIPQSWHKVKCAKDDIRRWDVDHRERKTTLNNRHETTVLVMYHELGNPKKVLSACSGVMVDEVWLLTAAHCVTDDNGHILDERRIKVCTGGNAYPESKCGLAEEITKSPNYHGTGMKHDYAVVKIQSPFSATHIMYISRASNDRLKDVPHQNLAYPGYAKQCGSTAAPSQNNNYIAQYLYGHGAEVKSVKTNIIKTRHDGVGGHSGSPFFYCPQGNISVCEVGDSGYVTGVWSGWYNTFPNSGDGHRGPKGPAIRSWVIAETR